MSSSRLAATVAFETVRPESVMAATASRSRARGAPRDSIHAATASGSAPRSRTISAGSLRCAEAEYLRGAGGSRAVERVLDQFAQDPTSVEVRGGSGELAHGVVTRGADPRVVQRYAHLSIEDCSHVGRGSVAEAPGSGHQVRFGVHHAVGGFPPVSSPVPLFPTSSNAPEITTDVTDLSCRFGAGRGQHPRWRSSSRASVATA